MGRALAADRAHTAVSRHHTGELTLGPADMCTPGDRPDPTAETRKPFCTGHYEQYGFRCTRPEGHGGQHVAGTGRYVAATWDETYLTAFIGEPQW